MPGSESLFHMHALLESDYAILMYILHFLLCAMAQSGGYGTILEYLDVQDSWGLPMRAKSSKQRCPALCLYGTILPP